MNADELETTEHTEDTDRKMTDEENECLSREECKFLSVTSSFALIDALRPAGSSPFFSEGGLAVKPREATKILYSGFSLGLDRQTDRLTIRR